MDEEPLFGGNVGTVVRVGHTVRRTTGPWTPAVHSLLVHLEAVGFAYSPRVLGFDPQGREILTYIDGETVVPAHHWPSWDVAFAAWTFAPIHTRAHAHELGAPTDIGRRLRLMCDTYGPTDRDDFLTLVAQRMQASINGIESFAASGEAAFVQMIADGHVARMHDDRAELEEHSDEWVAALAGP